MVPWENVRSTDLKALRGICVDIDDTLTTDGKLPPSSFQALWNLKEKGYLLVPVTGRPAGWCDHIARFWPVSAVVGENGAFSFFMAHGKRSRLDTETETDRQANRQKLKELKKSLIENFPKLQFASDQAYREADLAIDFSEDVTPPWSQAQIDQVVAFCESKGALAKVSSIHINTWFGRHDKIKGFKKLLQGNPSWPQDLSQWIYVGDSPNDEPMFHAFPKSVGVANIQRFANRLHHPPRWVTRQKSADGFCEVAQALLA